MNNPENPVAGDANTTQADNKNEAPPGHEQQMEQSNSGDSTNENQNAADDQAGTGGEQQA